MVPQNHFSKFPALPIAEDPVSLRGLHQKVTMTIAVIVFELNLGAFEVSRQPQSLCDVAETELALVAPQGESLPVEEEEVQELVSVVITEKARAPLPGSVREGHRGQVFETLVPEIVEKKVPRPIQNEEVLQTIAIQIAPEVAHGEERLIDRDRLSRSPFWQSRL
jgi:hypothetical protein